MFGSLASMVNGKMCLSAGPGRMMCRINPEMHDGQTRRKGCSTVVMRGREYKGYIYISEKNLETQADFMHWIDLALKFNENIGIKLISPNRNEACFTGPFSYFSQFWVPARLEKDLWENA